MRPNRVFFTCMAIACLALGGLSEGSVAADATSGQSGKWSVANLPQPPNSGNGEKALAVSCVRSNWCIAVGENWSLEVHTRVTLAELWTGAEWSAMDTPYPPGLNEGWLHGWYAELAGVSCVSTTDCVAVGSYRDSGEEVQPLAEQWNGSTWTITSSPLPHGAVAAALN